MIHRDNIAGTGGNILVRLFLLPGRVIQWAMYMFVAGKRYGQVRQDTRLARSPIMTAVYSIAVWWVLVSYCLGVFG
jgi:hypothetical protein